MKNLKKLLEENFYEASNKELNKIAKKITFQLYKTNLQRENLTKEELKHVLHKISDYTNQLSKGI